MPRLCEYYPGIYLTTEEKAWKNLSQGTVYIIPTHSHITKPAHIHTHTYARAPAPTHYKTRTHTHTPHTRARVPTHYKPAHTHMPTH